MGKFILFLDPGHGGMMNGQYVTPGKRSPKFPDGSQLFEGVNNRLIVNLIHNKLLALNIPELEIYNVAPGEEDRALEKRTKFANDLWIQKGKPKAAYMSIHSDAAGDGISWHSASGLSVYTSVGQTDSDELASFVLNNLKAKVPNVKWRVDNMDGDLDKEEDFWVLRKTGMPSILSENGFHTNLEECTKMRTPQWREMIAEAHVQGLLEFRNKQLGLAQAQHQ